MQNVQKSATVQEIFEKVGHFKIFFYLIDIFKNKSNKVEFFFNTFFKINTVIIRSFQILNICSLLAILILIILVSTLRYIWVLLYTMSNLMSISMYSNNTRYTTKKTWYFSFVTIIINKCTYIVVLFFCYNIINVYRSSMVYDITLFYQKKNHKNVFHSFI
jgi:hypothetical protein